MLVKSLIECGFDKESRDLDDNTPLILAAMYRHLEIVNFLVFIGANINAMNVFQRTPLIQASMRNNYDIVENLISVGADKNVVDYRGQTAANFCDRSVNEILSNII